MILPLSIQLECHLELTQNQKKDQIYQAACSMSDKQLVRLLEQVLIKADRATTDKLYEAVRDMQIAAKAKS